MAINRWVSLGFESSFGSATAGKYFLDPTRVSLDSPSDPFIRYSGSAGRGERAIVPAVYIPEGDIETVLDTWRVGGLLRAFIPEENYEQQSPDKSGTSTTLSAQEAAGQTVLSVVMADNFTVNDLIQIGADDVGSEVHKVTAKDDILDTLTIEDPLTRIHAGGAAVVKLNATPKVKHIFAIGGDSDALDSVTVRVAKDFDEQAFQGAVVNQLQLSLDHNGLLSLTASIVAQKDVPGSVTALPGTGLVTVPYAAAHLSTAILVDPDNDPAGNKDTAPYIRGAEFTFSNNVEGEDGVRMGSRFPIEHLAKGLDVTARLTLVFRNRDQYEDFWGGSSPSESAVVNRDLKLDFAIGSNYTLGVYVYACYTVTPASEVSGRDMLVQTLEYVSLAPDPTSIQGSIQLQNTEEYRYF